LCNTDFALKLLPGQGARTGCPAPGAAGRPADVSADARVRAVPQLEVCLAETGELTPNCAGHRHRIDIDAGIDLNDWSVEGRRPAAIGPLIADCFPMDLMAFCLSPARSLDQHWSWTGAEDLNDGAA